VIPERLADGRALNVPREAEFPIGASITLAQLEGDPHPLLARLREREPVSWLPVLDGWLVTRYDLALEVMRGPDAFTVDDARFSTGRVVGPSMLSLDGEQHAGHRAPFVGPFRPVAVRERFAEAVAAEADRLIDAFAPGGAAELRRSFAGPLAAATMARALGLGRDEVGAVLAWYDAIVAAVTEITAGQPVPRTGTEAFDELRVRLEAVIADGGESSLLGSAASASPLSTEQIVSNAAVLLFGGIETTEGMIANAALALLAHPEQLETAARDQDALDRAIEESLRLEPAAAMVDRYTTREVELGPVTIGKGELVHVSLAGANRDPSVFPEPDAFDPSRAAVRRHLAFAHGPHVCVGVHLARLEARAGLAALLRQLPGIRLDPHRPAAARGLVFRKPPELHVLWG
jgi:cytochrome P450